DNWREPAEELRNRTSNVPLHIVGLAIGSDADLQVLSEVATVVLQIDRDIEDSLHDYFDWVTETVTLTAEQQPHPDQTRIQSDFPPLRQTITRRFARGER